MKLSTSLPSHAARSVYVPWRHWNWLNKGQHVSQLLPHVFPSHLHFSSCNKYLEFMKTPCANNNNHLSSLKNFVVILKQTEFFYSKGQSITRGCESASTESSMLMIQQLLCDKWYGILDTFPYYEGWLVSIFASGMSTISGSIQYSAGHSVHQQLDANLGKMHLTGWRKTG